MAARVVGPLVNEYGSRLVIMGLNINTEGGAEIYTAAMAELTVPQDRQVIPFILIGDHALVGAAEVTDQLPGIVEAGLESGGISWPEVAGLAGLFRNADATLAARTPAAQTAATETASSPTATALAPVASLTTSATGTPAPVATAEPSVAPRASPTPLPAEDAPPTPESPTTLLLVGGGLAGVAVLAVGLVLARRRRV